MVILGDQDQVVDSEQAAEGLRDVPGVRITTLEGVGHTPQIEAPKETAALIEEFARDAGDEILSEAPPRDVGLGKEGKKRGGKQGRKGGRDEGRKRGKKGDEKGGNRN